MEEIWQDIPSYEGLYQVSNKGNIRSLNGNHYIMGNKTDSGYLRVTLHRNGHRSKYRIHRLVAEVFIPNPNNYNVVRHKNGVKTDNQVDNLEWYNNSNTTPFHKTECSVKNKEKSKPVTYIQPKWTDETVIELAKQCGSATEFKNKFSGAYHYAHKSELWKSFDWFKHNTSPDSKTYVIYAYEDVINKFVYVGLTNDIKRRVKEHRKKNYKNKIRQYDIVRQYFEDNGLVLPEPVIKCSGINGFEAQELEDYYKEEYRKNGWNIINTGKTGKKTSSLGNLAFTPLTREDCAKVVKLYCSRKEIENNAWRVWATIKRNGWEDLFPPKKGGPGFHADKAYYRNKIGNICDRNVLRKENYYIYEAIKKHGWLDDFFPPRYVNICNDDILELIKKYNNIKELRIGDYELYEKSKEIFKLKEIFIEKKKANRVLTSRIGNKKAYSVEIVKNICNEYVNSSIGYKTLGKKYHIDPKNVKKMLIDNNIDIKPKHNHQMKWTINSAKEHAYNFKSRYDLKRNSCSCYNLLRKNNLLDEIYGKRNINSLNEITTELCIEIAINYRTWDKFARSNRKCAAYCRNEGIVDLIKEEIRKVHPDYKPCPNNSIDIEMQKQICWEKAMLCKTKFDFRTEYKHEYGIASANRWLKEYTWLTGCKGVKDEEKKNKTIEVAKQCITKREFREEHPVEYTLAVKYKILKEFTWLKGCKKENNN